MSQDLRSINNFDDLLAYLGTELDWPVEEYTRDQLTFEYDADELGLKDEEVAKLSHGTIQQLRPLQGQQPFGIFFVEFDHAKLPIVVLRRILSQLVIKKRSSTSPAEAKRWDASDLIFISAFGENEHREIAFAHFYIDPETTDLPVLRVLGWHGDDTHLKSAAVARTLKDRLSWPANETDENAWRQQWRSAFRHRPGHTISTAKELASAMAGFAKRIRDAARDILPYESENGRLRKLFNGFRDALIHDLSEEDFTTYYAETICYGLFTVAVSRTELSEGKYGTAVAADDVAHFVPVTNPFLKDMLWSFLEAGGRNRDLNFDDLGINEIVSFFNSSESDLPAVIRDFGSKRPGEDPVIHLYEDFLKQFDGELRKKRGVYYTPKPVVSYIVRSVHELLQTEFGLDDGLASTVTWGEMLEKRSDLKLPLLTDLLSEKRTISLNDPFVQILDPATGTATFLVEVIEVTYRHLGEKWKKEGLSVDAQKDAWNDYVPKHLLPRLHGYELMMAPYAIAHMKIGLKLAETGYRFGTNVRAHIYLTNALEKTDDKQAKLIGFDALAQEAEAVNRVKKSKRFTVIIGNPPYANYSANLSPEARRIVDKYRNFRGVPIRERNQLQFERNIQEDCVKFISIAQDLIAASGVGVFCYITNGTMLASSSLRGLRENLTVQFSSLFELNIHGGGNEIIAGAEDDENVFDIVQSVAIHIYIRSKPGGASELSYADLLGRRAQKFAALASRSVRGTEWRRIQPDAENSSFTPQDEAGGGPNRRLDSAFVKFGAGIKTGRDAAVIGFDNTSLIEAVQVIDAKLASLKHAQSSIHSLLYRPFDVRKIFYHENVIASRSLPTMKHVVAGPNIGFVCSSTWTTPDRFSVGVSRLMVEMKTGTHDRGTTFFPLYRYEALMGGKAEQVHNFTSEFVKEWCATTHTRFIPTGHGDGQMTTGPEDVFCWLYGLFYSPEYRRRHRAALSQRFPIVLLTSNLELFRALTRIGGELSALHLLESPSLAQPLTEFVGTVPLVSKVGWTKDSGGTVWINASGTKTKTSAGTMGFQGVPENVWNFHIGGYQVCEKWLKDRKGRILSTEDIAHYHKIVVALSETIRLMAEVDQVIASHGGWPGAFAMRAS
jgi:type I restriction-modification system DNA methylase subunit